MKLLLDTPILVWWLADDRRLPRQAERFIEDMDNHILVSAASIWELAIKAGLGRVTVDPDDVERAIESSGFHPLPITGRHAVHLAELPTHHRDPFDRILLAQSLSEPLRLLTHDRLLAQYGDLVLMV